MLMDLNYWWCQPEEHNIAGRLWRKVAMESRNRSCEQDGCTASSNKETATLDTGTMHVFSGPPVFSTFSYSPNDIMHNPPFQMDQVKISKDKDKETTNQILNLIRKKREYNKGSTYGYEEQIKIGMLSTSAINLYPWNQTKTEYEKSLKGLHEEILDFYKFIMPTKEEKIMRENVIATLKTVIQKEWPDAIVDVFGSFQTELHLPTSDIDVVINGKWDNPLWKLNDMIKRSGIASDCKVLDKATVPIVKMTDKESDVRIDISFNMANGIKSAELIKCYISQYPQLPKLVLVLKQYLLQLDLNEVWTGGISSYSLILMCVSFMKDCTKKNIDTFVNLGRTLILFLEFYGRNFDYSNTAIRTGGDMYFVPKEEIMKNMDASHWSSILCIEDPLNSGNDIGRSSYGALQVKYAFDDAFSKLAPMVLAQSSHLFENQKSILGRIIRITPEVTNYRAFIKKKYSGFNYQSAPEVMKGNPHTNNSNLKVKSTINEKGDVAIKRDLSVSSGFKMKPHKQYNFNNKKATVNIQDFRVTQVRVSTPNNTISNSPTSAANETNNQSASKYFKKNRSDIMVTCAKTRN